MTEISLSEWDDVGELVERALDLPATERDGWLRNACGADHDRLTRARRALAAASEAQSFLDRPAADLVADLVSDAAAEADDGDDLPETIGPYRVRGRLGRGGMGEVYLADRADDEFERRVAIKVVQAGLGQDLVARFRHERQLLASLDHPHIARLYDGGVAEDGRPYLVMEYVDGRSLDRYADEERLTVDDRLAMFEQVCDAVDLAHRRLIVHRDLKPGNVLVEKKGSAKLLDFGVAKLLDPAASADAAPVTRAGFQVMTPEYASPEQFLGEPTSTATDVYALGVILYELLAGCRPHEASSPRELEHHVLERDPEPPSVTCRSSRPDGSAEVRAAARRTTVDGLARQLRGDLDNIVLTALRREPERRYASVAALRADIDRHRTSLPVSARPATVRYRAGKFVRRHRVGVAAAVLVAAAVVIGTTTTLVQAREAAREGRRVEQIRDFLVGVFEVSDPDRSGGATVTARELLDQGSRRIERGLTEDPVLRADMLGVLGRLYRQLGLFDSARPHLQEALSLRRAEGAPPDSLVESLTELAAVRVEDGEYDDADALLSEAFDLAVEAQGARGPAVASVTTDLAALHRARGEFAEAEALSRDAVDIRRALGDPAGIATALNGLGVLLTEAGQPNDATPVLREALALAREAHGEPHTEVALAECNLAQALNVAGDLEAAVEMFQSCIDDRRTLLGDRHPAVALALNNLSMVHSARNEYADAERLLQEALAIQRETYGERHRTVAGTINNLAILAYQQQRYGDAADRFRELIDVWSDLLGPDHPDTLTTTNNLGMTLRSAGDLAAAETILTDVLDRRERVYGADSLVVAESLLNLGNVLERRGRYTRARALAVRGIAILEREHPDGHLLTAIGYMIVGRARLGEGAAAAALADFDRAKTMREGIFGPEHLQTAEARVGRARALQALGRVADARVAVETALADLRAAGHAVSVTAQEAEKVLASLGGRTPHF